MNRPKAGVIIAALLAIVLLAAGVCALHRINAVSLRGEAAVAEYVQTDGAAENLLLMMDDPWKDRGIVYITGALLRLDQRVGEVRVRAGLIPEKVEAGQPAVREDEAILLNTEMVRKWELAKAYDCDDHCGFHAAVDEKYLTQNTQYRVVLVDETDGAKRMVETDMTVVPIEGGLAFARGHAPKEAQDAK